LQVFDAPGVREAWWDRSYDWEFIPFIVELFNDKAEPRFSLTEAATMALT
jgi:hypothetical protein